MTTAYLFDNIPVRQLDNNGAPVAGARLHTWVANTTTPLATYTDATATTPLPNPIVADSQGFFPQVWGIASAYDLEARKADDSSVLWSRLNVNPGGFIASMASSIGSTLIGYWASATAYVTTVQERLTRRVYVYDYLSPAMKADVLARTELVDTSPGVNLAIARANVLGNCALVFDSGPFRIDFPLTPITADAVYVEGAGPRASALRIYHDCSTGPALSWQDDISPGTAYIFAGGMREISVRAMVDTVVTNPGVLLNKCSQFKFTGVQIEDFACGMNVLGGLQVFGSDFQIVSGRVSLWSVAKAGSYFAKFGKALDGTVVSECYLSNFNARRNDSTTLVQDGFIFEHVDGVTCSNFHIMGVTGNEWLVGPPTTTPTGGGAPTGTEQLTGISASNGWFDGNSAMGIKVFGATTGGFGEIRLNGCHFLTQSNIAIFVDSTAASFAGIKMSGGEVLKSVSYGVLVRNGKNVFNGVTFSACNTSSTANAGGITFDNNCGGGVVTGCRFEQTYQGVTSANMIGVRVNAGTSSGIGVMGNVFDLAAGALDVSNASTSNSNQFTPNYSTKVVTSITAVAGSSVPVTSVGETFFVNVAGTPTVNNLTAREEGHRVTLIFGAPMTFTHAATGGIYMLSHANYTTVIGDALTFVYSATFGGWREIARSLN